jgi:diguanylate cyclase (GGDEF)-like protein/PAS domain S-box-containing protein
VAAKVPTREELQDEVRGLRRQVDEFMLHLPDALVEMELQDYRITYVNRMGRILFGYEADEKLAGMDSRRFFCEGEFERSLATLRSYVEHSLSTGEPYVRPAKHRLYELQMLRKDGTSFIAETQSAFVLDGHGLPVRMQSIVRDVTDRKEMERQLAELSMRDPLTGCYNRRHLERRRADLERPTAHWACLVFDLKDFKAINDTYGHDEGDRVLQGFTHFLSRQHRTDDVLLRLGGDEFALFLFAASEAEAQAVTNRLLEAAALDSPAGFSMGLAYRRPGEGVQAALERADRVMYASRGRRIRKLRRKV